MLVSLVFSAFKGLMAKVRGLRSYMWQNPTASIPHMEDHVNKLIAFTMNDHDLCNVKHIKEITELLNELKDSFEDTDSMRVKVGKILKTKIKDSNKRAEVWPLRYPDLFHCKIIPVCTLPYRVRKPSNGKYF